MGKTTVMYSVWWEAFYWALFLHFAVSESLHLLQASVHCKFHFLHEHLLLTQPFVQLHSTMSLQAFGMGGRDVSTGLRTPSTSFHPDSVGDWLGMAGLYPYKALVVSPLYVILSSIT